MASVVDVLATEDETYPKFNSFAVLDLEAADLPSLKYNKVGITELSIYGIAREELEKERSDGKVPDMPRVIHKLTLMINPRMRIDSVAEKISGLDNFMLEHESPFNENAVNVLTSFLLHLRQPVCLVAHNGKGFDFPMVKSVMDKCELSMPESVYCIDSLRAFHDIDKIRLFNSRNIAAETEEESDYPPDSNGLETVLETEKEFDARSQNETTPKRPTASSAPPASAALKRKRNSTNSNKNDEFSDEEEESENVKLKPPPKSKRSLNFGTSMSSTTAIDLSNENISYLLPPGRKWFPPKFIYKLENLFERTFEEKPKKTHYAEADVLSLTQLMLHYGNDFIEYAERHAVKFQSIPAYGKK